MPRFKTAGSKIYIGPPMGDTVGVLTSSNFTALAFTEIKNTTNIGSVGDTSAEISSDEIGSGRTIKAKGTRNAGNQTITCNDNPTDPGQAAMIAAQQDDTSNDYAFKLQFTDGPFGGQGSIRYYAGKVMSIPENLGTANNFATIDFNIGINSNIVYVAAGAGSAPANSVLPAISGTAVHGNVLSVSTGTWTGTPTSYSYQWNKAGVPIANEDALDPSYTIETGDVGSALTCTVTASNSAGSASVTSAATATVT